MHPLFEEVLRGERGAAGKGETDDCHLRVVCQPEKGCRLPLSDALAVGCLLFVKDLVQAPLAFDDFLCALGGTALDLLGATDSPRIDCGFLSHVPLFF